MSTVPPPARFRAPVMPRAGAANRLVLVIAGMMAFLAVLTLTASLAADRLGSAWAQDLTGAATVELTGTPAEIAERLPFVLDILETTQGIAAARPLNAEEQAALLAPWLGADADLETLPVPQLVDVTLTGPGPDRAALQQRLDLSVSGAVYDDHAAWRAPLARAVSTLMAISVGATVLIAACAILMVAFAAQATLAANQDIVRTVRLIGAEDAFIAAAFVNRLALHAGLGGLAGAVAATGCLSLLPDLADPVALPGAEVGAGALDPIARAAAFATAVPLVLALVAWITARLTVMATLRRMP